MKKLFLFFILLGSIISAQEINEKEAVKKVIDSAYVSGIHNLGDIKNTEKGFHPGFDLLGTNNNQLTKYPIYTWIESTIVAKTKGDKRPLTICEYENIDITGNAACVKLKLLRENKVIFTDYLFLYKFTEGWKIVSKVYYKH